MFDVQITSSGICVLLVSMACVRGLMAWIKDIVSSMLTIGMGHFRKQPVSSGARNLHFIYQEDFSA